MGSKLSPKDNALYKSTDEVLHYIWDPIGVSGSPYARDEYYGYLPQVFNMVKNKEKKETIVDYLVTIVTDQLMEPPMFALKAPRRSAVSSLQTE